MQSFTARMPLLTATSAFGLGRRRWNSPQQLSPYLGQEDHNHSEMQLQMIRESRNSARRRGRLAALAEYRQQNNTIQYTPVTDVARQRLRSATQKLMVVPRHRLTTVGRRAFAVHGPMVRNSLPDYLCAQQDYESFRQGLKTWLFSRY